MLFTRPKLIEKFALLFQDATYNTFIIQSDSKEERERFLIELIQENIFWNVHYQQIKDGREITHIDNPDLLIIHSDDSSDYSSIRTIINQYQSNPRVILLTETEVLEDDAVLFSLPWISFREYSEASGIVIKMPEIMNKEADIDKLNTLRDIYLHTWQRIENIEQPETTEKTFENVFEKSMGELFEKERSDYLEFLRNIAMSVGEIFKEDKLAKNMGISRRKVKKYLDTSIKHKILSELEPLVLDKETELSRHTKLYFRNLSYASVLLGNLYYHGSGKQWVMENFIYLELERKIWNTHSLYFYKKKSGSEISFILENRQNWLFTPIDVTIKSTIIEPKSFEFFDKSYSDKVETYIITNDSLSNQTTLGEKPLIIIPHIAI